MMSIINGGGDTNLWDWNKIMSYFITPGFPVANREVSSDGQSLRMWGAQASTSRVDAHPGIPFSALGLTGGDKVRLTLSGVNVDETRALSGCEIRTGGAYVATLSGMSWEGTLPADPALILDIRIGSGYPDITEMTATLNLQKI